MIRLFQSETYYPSYLEGHSGVTAVEYRICKLTDGTWWDFTASAFQAAPADPSDALTEDDNGLWVNTTGWAIPDSNSTYRILFEVTDTGTYFADGPMIIVNDAEPATAVLAGTVESGLELKQAIQAIMSFAAALVTGGATNTLVYRDYANSKNRLSVTVDTNGNRSAITYNFD